MGNIRVDARQPQTTLDAPGSDPHLQGDGEQYMHAIVVIARTERCTVGSSPTGCMPSLGQGVPLTMRPLDNASLGLHVSDTLGQIDPKLEFWVQCYSIPDRCVPDGKFLDVASLGQSVPWLFCP